MKFILDHCVSRPLLTHLSQFEIEIAGKLGWSELTNGKLLAASEAAGYSALITVDKGFKAQQNLAARSISVVLLAVQDTRLHSLLPLIPALTFTLENLEPGRLYEVEG